MIIPQTINSAVERLNGIEGLLTKKGWERAAVVAAYVRVGKVGDNQHTQVAENRHLSARAFAALGVAGLTNHETVGAYVTAWVAATGVHPEPGQVIEDDFLDTLGPFPGTSTTTGARNVMDPDRR